MYHDSVWEQLEINSKSIVGKWSQLILDTYPPDTADFLQHEKDRFVNPVGYVISQELKTIFNELLGDINLEKLSLSLDEFIKIRAVQDFSPSRAIGFIFLLKQAVLEELADKIAGNPTSKGLLEFKSRIDKMALLAFDIYMGYRERIYEIKVSEAEAQREMAFRMLDRIHTMDNIT
jgi:hypothetical protein